MRTRLLRLTGLLCSEQHRALSSVSRRSHVRFVNPASVRWFPGHMRKGMNEIDRRIAQVDVIIEVHDARIPFSGRSSFLQRFDQIRPHILILNKMDLAEKITDMSAFRSSLIQQSKFEGHNLLDVYLAQLNAPERNQRLLRYILDELPRLASDLGLSAPGDREFSTREDAAPPPTLMTIAVGIPNCGKSTLINALRTVGHGGSGKAARVGRIAGQTRVVGHPIVISRNASDPTESGHLANMRIMMLDTPGILEPKARSLTEQLSLCVCGAVNPDSVDREILVDYLLFWWNYRERTEYVSVLGLAGPTDDVVELLVQVCAQNEFFLTSSVRGARWQACDIEAVSELNGHTDRVIPDFNRAATHILRLFERGAFGPTTFLPSDEEAASPYFVLSQKSAL